MVVIVDIVKSYRQSRKFNFYFATVFSVEETEHSVIDWKAIKMSIEYVKSKVGREILMSPWYVCQHNYQFPLGTSWMSHKSTQFPHSLEVGHTQQVNGSVPQGCLEFRCLLQAVDPHYFHVIWLQTGDFCDPPSLDLKICQNGSHTSERHSVYISWFIIKDVNEHLMRRYIG